MNDPILDGDILAEVIDASDRRRAERRRFLRVAGGGAAAAGGLSLLAACGGDSGSSSTDTPTPTPTATSTSALADADVLNFAINLEYLEAQFYSMAAFGKGLDASLLTGTGTQGAVTGGRQVSFSDPLVGQYAREIAADEIAHVGFLRSALGVSVVAQPAINIDGGATGAFTAAARAANIVSSTGTFDPYADDNSFLLGAYLFEDVGVSAYKGAAPLITNSLLLEAAAGILAAEAYHAGLIRTVLYRKGLTVPAGQISDARDSLDGASDLDQGIAGDGTTSNVIPADNATAIAFGRTSGQVLNIVYLNKRAVVGGGFFPSGVNGNIRVSAASD